MDQLLGETNARRGRAGAAPLAYVAPAANLAVSQYLADLTPLMWENNTCYHGMGYPVARGWNFVAAAGLDAAVSSEVLGCPMDGFHWTPEQIADHSVPGSHWPVLCEAPACSGKPGTVGWSQAHYDIQRLGSCPRTRIGVH